MKGRPRNPEALLEEWLRPRGRFRSPVVNSLLALAILLGKAIACQHSPGRAVIFDAMLMVPISMLAYYEGLATGMVAAVVTVAVDIVMSAKMTGVLIPQYVTSPITRNMALARLFSFEVLAAIVATLSRRARREMDESQQRIREYIRKIQRLEEHNEAIEQEARDKEAEFEKSLLKYSSLVYLLEESAQKIYSNLEIDRLFNSLFRVLEECFGSTCASVYLKNNHNEAFLLANACGAEQWEYDIPMLVRSDDPQVAELIQSHRPTWWGDRQYAERFADAPKTIPAVMSGVLVDKTEVVGIVNVHAVDRVDPPDVMLMGMVCNIASIAFANARLFGEVQWMAERDPLTKLYNRRTFHDEMVAQIAARTADSGSFGLLMLDIDHFKAFNDTYGHQAGDAVLEWFASHCKRWAGEENPVFRYGGEEFTIIMPRADARAARNLAEKIRRRINEMTFHYGQNELQVMLSCGVAVFPENGLDDDELVRKADRALYRAKASGRNRVVVSRAAPGEDSSVVSYQTKVARTQGSGPAAPGGPAGRRR
ncbi:MAG: diguanylate cyclase [Planctomycetota bacterium]